MSCPKGQIMKEAYTYIKKSTGKKVKVKKTCVEDKGKPGKGPKLITIPSYDVGLMSEFGYELKDSKENRSKSIKKSIKKHGKLKILRHLNALRTLQKSNEKYYNKLDNDIKMIQKIDE